MYAMLKTILADQFVQRSNQTNEQVICSYYTSPRIRYPKQKKIKKMLSKYNIHQYNLIYPKNKIRYPSQN